MSSNISCCFAVDMAMLQKGSRILVRPHTILHEFAGFRTCMIANGYDASIFASRRTRCRPPHGNRSSRHHRTRSACWSLRRAHHGLLEAKPDRRWLRSDLFSGSPPDDGGGLGELRRARRDCRGEGDGAVRGVADVVRSGQGDAPVERARGGGWRSIVRTG